VSEPAVRPRGPAPAPGPGAAAVPGRQPALDLRGVGFSYLGKRPRHRLHGPPAALSGIDLTVRHGEFVTVTGPQRSGKTTLLHVVALMLRPTAGRYLLHGTDTAGLRDRDLAALRGREIGLVCQPGCLLAGRSVLDNVMLPLVYAGRTGQSRRAAALGAIDRTGLGGQAHRLASELSAGERQLTAIARALVTAPRLLVCDDPTAGLDDGQAIRVVALLTGLRAGGCTVLAATGDQLAAAYGDRCLRLGGGPGAGTGWWPA